MSIHINETLSQGLSLLTYNGNSIIIPKDHQLNIFMGIGLWSVRDGLSEGLPVDVMQMLLSATIIKSKIMEANHGKSSKVIILIADSMAVCEGAEKERVAQLVWIYKKSLEPLLDLLNIQESSEIILSSDLEKCSQYEKALASVENSHIVRQLKIEDKVHCAYIRTQTAITHYMKTYRHVGIKVGWICAESSKQLNRQVSAPSLKHWDELKFDRWYEAICEDSAMQYLYTKAGLKQSGHDKHINVSEGSPYTAYPKDQRYIVQIQDKKNIKAICPIQKRVAAHWKGVAEICLSLMQARLVKCTLLPKDCIKKNNVIATVYNMLNHWAHSPVLSSQIMDDSVSILLSSWTCLSILEDPYRQLPMLKNEYLFSRMHVINKPKVRRKYVLL